MNSKEITSNSKFFHWGSYSIYRVVESDVVVESGYIKNIGNDLVPLVVNIYSW